MNERNDTFENQLTEENLPEPKEREDVAENLRLDPEVNSAKDDAAMADDTFGVDEPADGDKGARKDG